MNSEKLKVVSIATKGIHGHCSYSIQHSKIQLEKLNKRTIKKHTNRKGLKVFLCVDDDSIYGKA